MIVDLAYKNLKNKLNTMRPRNVLTQTNNMRKLMGLPLLNEDTGATAEDVKKKVLTEDRAFSLGFGNQGGLTLAEDDLDPMEDNVMQEETIEETTEAEETEEEGVGAPVNDVVEEQDEFGDGPLGIETGIDVGSPQPGDGEGGLGLSTDAQVFAEGSFSKYNITLQDKMDLLREQEEEVEIDGDVDREVDPDATWNNDFSGKAFVGSVIS